MICAREEQKNLSRRRSHVFMTPLSIEERQLGDTRDIAVDIGNGRPRTVLQLPIEPPIS